MENKRPFIYFPIVFAVALILGIVLGTQLEIKSARYDSAEKLLDILDYIENEYVDTVSRERLIDKTITQLLQDLDPHSYYFTAEELAANRESLEGNFKGIGVRFQIQKDTVIVIAPIADGPSEKAGIKAGDRIVKAKGEIIAGVNITNDKVMKMLKGEEGTPVEVSVMRRGEDQPLDFEIIRGIIPIQSLDAAYMATETTGYIRLNKFAKNTYEEFYQAAKQLKREGMESLILDLRGNGGGVMEAATNIANEFLAEDKMIMFTQGRSKSKKTIQADGKGELKNIDVAFLIDEQSASASEILAGAIQDNDRGWIIGRRSFGKGLIQKQTIWPDGSGTRLTIARYYTPTGRSIQKPYDKGAEQYYKDFQDRLSLEELNKADNFDFPDSLKFTTPGGKTVYGGGGIMPDIYVPFDTSGFSFYLSELTSRGIIYQFAFDYTDRNRQRLEDYSSFRAFDGDFRVQGEVMDEFLAFAEKNGVETHEEELEQSRQKIQTRIKAFIANHLWDSEGMYPVINRIDPAMIKALEVLEN